MIASFRHKGLKLYYDKGYSTKLLQVHVPKIRLILTRLDSATSAADMNVPGYGLHQLSGEYQKFWAVKVDKNYRIIFRFEGEHAFDVDYLDYH